MTDRPLIAIDVDEVLVLMHQPFLVHHNTNYGSEYEYPDAQGRYYLEEFETELDDVALSTRFKSYVASDSFTDQQPIQDSTTVVAELAKKYNLTVITSRQAFLEESTKQFLSKHYGDSFKSEHFTEHQFKKGMKIPKSEICKKLGVTHLVDDNLLTAIDCSKAGIKVVLFGDYHWNQSDDLPDDVTRCNDWAAVAEYFHV
jgi:uncharacterized HAD superfamily protein